MPVQKSLETYWMHLVCTNVTEAWRLLRLVVAEELDDFISISPTSYYASL